MMVVPLPVTGKANSSKNVPGGFTLVELMITIVVLAILVSLAAPAFSRLVASNKVRSAASDLQMAMLRARSEAVSRNIDITVDQATGGWQNGWSVNTSPPTPDTPAVVESYGGFSGLLVSTKPDSVVKVTYNSSGRATAEAAVEFKSDNYPEEVRCVSVDLAGRPLITKAEC